MFAVILASIRSGNFLWGDASVPELILLTLAWVVFCSLPLCGLGWVIYFLFSLPLRRLERARLFLDLMGAALKSGRNLEQTIVAISQTREASVGVRFHLLAAHLEQGLRLFDALDKVPRLLPPHISAMLRVGQKTGDLSRVIPACRQALEEGTSQIWGATNYLVVLMFGVLPAIPVVFGMMATVIFPKFRELFHDMGVTPPTLTVWMFDHGKLLMLPIIAGALLVYLGVFLYVSGPRVTSFLDPWLGSASRWFQWRLPWKRKRLQRNFSAMLAILLDAEVPEAEAVELAAESTANRGMKQRAEKALEELSRGATLTEALRHIDEAGEFRWRLTNASHGQRGFGGGGGGGHDALEAQAFQQEQAAAQLITTALVLCNGLVVGLIATGTFSVLIAIIQAGVLW
jgi:type II secretory pathway component PulF